MPMALTSSIEPRKTTNLSLYYTGATSNLSPYRSEQAPLTFNMLKARTNWPMPRSARLRHGVRCGLLFDQSAVRGHHLQQPLLRLRSNENGSIAEV